MDIKTKLAFAGICFVFFIFLSVLFVNNKLIKHDYKQAIESLNTLHQKELNNLDSLQKEARIIISKDSIAIDSISRVNIILAKKRKTEKIRYIHEISKIKHFNDATRGHWIDSVSTFLSGQR